MDYIYLKELYPNQNLINGFENLNYNKNIFYGSESLKDTISRIYQAIVKFIQNIWNWIKEQFRKLKSLLDFKQRKMNTIKKVVNNISINDISEEDAKILTDKLRECFFLINNTAKYEAYPIPPNDFVNLVYLFASVNNNLELILRTCIHRQFDKLNNKSIEALYSDLRDKKYILNTQFPTEIALTLTNPNHEPIKIPILYSLLNDPEFARSKKYGSQRYEEDFENTFPLLSKTFEDLKLLTKSSTNSTDINNSPAVSFIKKNNFFTSVFNEVFDFFDKNVFEWNRKLNKIPDSVYDSVRFIKKQSNIKSTFEDVLKWDDATIDNNIINNATKDFFDFISTYQKLSSNYLQSFMFLDSQSNNMFKIIDEVISIFNKYDSK